ncbi:TPA: hypothetical protein IP911_002968 [Listeria monocytogenes]|nr:hypothetical protein [Listeria monocytogenes]
MNRRYLSKKRSNNLSSENLTSINVQTQLIGASFNRSAVVRIAKKQLEEGKADVEWF